jgi:toxin ParE1/3/4
MKKLSLKISSEAYSDLEKIWIYTYQKWSKEQANKYYLQITDELIFLCSNFYSGKSADSIRQGYRVSFVQSHVIFYKLGSNQELEVIRILHQSMNIEKWLK